MKTNSINSMGHQFISRNANEIAEVFSQFQELNRIHHGNYVLYFDSRTWEVFDVLLATTVILHEPIHIRQLVIDMKQLANDITNVRLIGVANNRYNKQSQSCSLRNLKRFYPDNYTYFLPKYYGNE